MGSSGPAFDSANLSVVVDNDDFFVRYYLSCQTRRVIAIYLFGVSRQEI